MRKNFTFSGTVETTFAIFCNPDFENVESMADNNIVYLGYVNDFSTTRFWKNYRQVRKIRNDAFLLPAEMVEERVLALKIVFTSTNKTILIGLLARFGMSPSDRNSLGIAEKKVDDPFAHLDD